MGAIISLLARFLSVAFGSILGWVSSALVSKTLITFLTFAAKITFVLGLAAATVAYIVPLVSSLDITWLPQHALWFADQIQFAYCFTVIISAFIFRWAVGWLRSIL